MLGSSLLVVLFLVVTSSTSSPSSPDDEFVFDEYVREAPIAEYILCRGCGASVADSHHLLDKVSPHALHAHNETLLGRKRVLVQLLALPFSQHFQLVTASRALCQGVGEWERADSWFPGHYWRPCLCPDCGAQLGWVFESAQPRYNGQNTFFGLVLSHLVGETFADSLLVIPNAKQRRTPS